MQLIQITNRKFRRDPALIHIRVVMSNLIPGRIVVFHFIQYTHFISFGQAPTGCEQDQEDVNQEDANEIQENEPEETDEQNDTDTDDEQEDAESEESADTEEDESEEVEEEETASIFGLQEDLVYISADRLSVRADSSEDSESRGSLSLLYGGVR